MGGYSGCMGMLGIGGRRNEGNGKGRGTTTNSQNRRVSRDSTCLRLPCLFQMIAHKVGVIGGLGRTVGIEYRV